MQKGERSVLLNGISFHGVVKAISINGKKGEPLGKRGEAEAEERGRSKKKRKRSKDERDGA